MPTIPPPTRCMHIDMDTFFVSVERLFDPSLIGKPVVVGAGPHSRGVVAACSREAREYGIHSAMPSREAYKLCPHAVFISSNFHDYSDFSERVTNILLDSAPVVQKASVDEFYLDLSGCERVFGPEEEWCRALKQKIVGETGLPLTYGVARNRKTAKIAAKYGKKHGDIHVPDGMEREFLDPLPIRMMPGIGKKMEPKMLELGITTIGQLARMTEQECVGRWGKYGRMMHEHANGIDRSVIVPHRRQKSVSAEHTFGEDARDTDSMLTLLKHLSMRIGMELREKGFLARSVTLKLRYADFSTYTRASRCEATNADHAIYAIVERAFQRTYSRRKPVRLLGVGTSDFMEDCGQTELFAKDEARNTLYYKGVDAIRERFGTEIITLGGVNAVRRHKVSFHG